jgi:ketosteroid isomerase-like protein
LDLDEEIAMKQRKTGVQFFAGFVALAATAGAVFRGIRAAASRAGDENTPASLDAPYQEAVKKNDAATTGRILADDCVLVTGNGRKQTKADLLKESSSGEITYEHQEDTDRTVRVWNDTAVVTVLLWQKARRKGRAWTANCGSATCMCARLRDGATGLGKPLGHWRSRREPAGLAL